ncbi:carbonic anhydrase [Aquidulcibacter sp.]|uniref:carbonic anhydrase n=1 Tax=Aquidulcibacter sp. TaxID=2052990 RepID=UPI0025BDBD68|nr:carbonic anhydrase family protein [Aquidulcibacter sp.]MCA3693685.1 carbonic anhydrase family protein [Aquidulcibacter sp.]
MKRVLAGIGIVALVGVIGIGTAKALMSGEAPHAAAEAKHDAADAHSAPAAHETADAHAAPEKEEKSILSHLLPGKEGAHWDYEGANGPENWGKMAEANKACASGQEQSPIDLTGGVDAEVSNIALHWNPGDWSVVNNGHTIQVEGKDGGYATIDGERFDLIQFHFHTPSEHTIDGRNYPMEVHFVHKNAEGRLAVIGVLMMPGGENPLFSTIMEKAPKDEGSASLGMIEQRGMIAPIDGVYRYQGSLTTPPCSETVLWTVLSTPILVSQKDVEAFQALFPMNARPIQPVNRRYVLRD